MLLGIDFHGHIKKYEFHFLYFVGRDIILGDNVVIAAGFRTRESYS